MQQKCAQAPLLARSCSWRKHHLPTGRGAAPSLERANGTALMPTPKQGPADRCRARHEVAENLSNGHIFFYIRRRRCENGSLLWRAARLYLATCLVPTLVCVQLYVQPSYANSGRSTPHQHSRLPFPFTQPQQISFCTGIKHRRRAEWLCRLGRGSFIPPHHYDRGRMPPGFRGIAAEQSFAARFLPIRLIQAAAFRGCVPLLDC